MDKKNSIDEIVNIYATMGRDSAPFFASEDLVECMNQKVCISLLIYMNCLLN
jgi:hypothetical protein